MHVPTPSGTPHETIARRITYTALTPRSGQGAEQDGREQLRQNEVGNGGEASADEKITKCRTGQQLEPQRRTFGAEQVVGHAQAEDETDRG